MSRRILNATLNPETKDRLELALGLQNPVLVHFAQENPPDRSDWRAEYDFLTHSITIYLGIKELKVNGLIQVRNDLTFSLLHEYRHAYQHQMWTNEQWAEDNRLPYAIQECERDANEWAGLNKAIFSNIVKLTISTPKPYDHGRGAHGFARLSEVNQ